MKSTIALLFILLFYLLLQAFFLTQPNILMWDSAVYLGMAHHISTAGASGIWEPLRPVLWPLFLAIFIFLNLDPVFFGTLFNSILLVFSAFLLYQLVISLATPFSALFTVILFLFSQTLFFYTHHLFTEIPAIFFSILALYSFLRKKYFLSGLLLGVSTLTKFPAGILFPIFLLHVLFTHFKSAYLLTTGFFIILLPFLTLNYYFYSDPVYPFTESANSVNTFLQCTMLSPHPWHYYFTVLLYENPFLVLSIIGIITILRKRTSTYKLLLFSFLAPFTYFTYLPCKYSRYALLFLPFAAIIAGIGFETLFRNFKHQKSILLIIFLMSSILTVNHYLQTEITDYTPIQKEYLTYLHNKNLTGDIWISNPVSAIGIRHPLKLAYYKYYNSTRAQDIQQRITSPNSTIVLFDTCTGGMICPPNDADCPAATQNLLLTLYTHYNAVYLQHENNCTYYVFKRKNNTLFSDTSKTLISSEPETNANFTFVLSHAGIPVEKYIQHLTYSIATRQADRAEGLLVLSRLQNNQTLKCTAFRVFANKTYPRQEHQALLYETLASLNCGSREKYFLQASELWKNITPWRAELNKRLARNEPIILDFDETQIHPALPSYSQFNTTIIGASKILLTKNDTIITQTDRVRRDWLGLQLYEFTTPKILTTMSERLTYPESELRSDIGWHEGARLAEITVITPFENAVGTLAAKKNEKWYGADEQGIFRFEIPDDKILYPTTRYLTTDLAMIIDTHGINMLVEQTIRNNATTVLGCCDHPGKAKAAHYLSQKGIQTICVPDRFTYSLLGHQDSVLGSAPYHITNTTVQFGSRPITIRFNETIIVTNSTRVYYDTPLRYFTTLQNSIPLKIVYVDIDKNGLLPAIITAQKNSAHYLAARVFNSTDYTTIKAWLDEDKNNTAILFHSLSYPYGYLLFKDYPEQTSFDDPNPIIH